mgnify:CR=1 FL=1
MQRAGKQIFQRNVEVVKELSNKYMFNHNEFMKQIMIAIDLQDYTYFESYLHKLLFSISEKYEITPEEFDTISSILDNCYIMIASKQFIMDLKALDSLDNETAWNFNFEDLDKIGDFTVDVTYNGEYMPVMLKVCKASYTVSSNKHSDMEIYNVSLMRYNEQTRIIECFGTFAFSKELPNRIIVESDSQINCRRCASCKFFNEYTVKIKLGLEAPISFCLVSRKRIENAKCLYCGLPINPIEIMSAISHIVTMYANRKNLNRKNGTHTKQYKEHAVHVAHVDADTGKEHVISLKQLYDYEKINKPWQGGHHRSPVEHERREHVRVYRNVDGSIKKVVTVKRTTVNKSGDKPIYKIGG